MELAHLRAGGDLELFRAILKSFLREFSTDSPPRVATEPGQLLLQAKYLHKVCGGAGQLGATKLQDLAGAAERAARTGDVARVSGLMPRVSLELKLLHANAARLIGEGRAERPPPQPALAPDPVACDTEKVWDLVGQLRAQEFAVLDAMTELAGPLQRRLGEARFQRVDSAIQALRFAEAAAEIEAALAEEGT